MEIKAISAKNKKAPYCFCFTCSVNEEGTSDEFQGMLSGCTFYMRF